MKLNELKDNAGARKVHTRVGRGSSSGLGKTCGRGGKGQTARAGSSIHGFEGGQMPLYMRIPKRGFRNNFAREFASVNLGRIQAAIDMGKLKTGETITGEHLREAGLVRSTRDGVRLLAGGSLNVRVNFEVAGATLAAIQAVKAAGGSIKTTYTKVENMNRKGEPGKRVTRRRAAAEKRAAGAATA